MLSASADSDRPFRTRRSDWPDRKDRLIIGSRGSQLALWQANYIKNRIAVANPALAVDIQVIQTTGDTRPQVAFSQLGDKGFFTKELEIALAEGRVDLCVHSMKDVPTTLPAGMVLGPIPERAPAQDVLVARPGVHSLADLASGARIGTGSLRRRAQLAARGGGYTLVDLRGNIDSRVRRVTKGELDAVVIAAAGLERLGWRELISADIPIEELVPAVGQGALALEMRRDDALTAAACAGLADQPTEICVAAERRVLIALEGGCQVPLGAHAWIEADQFNLIALVANLDGSWVLTSKISGHVSASDDITQRVIQELIAQGAPEILQQIRKD